MKEVLDYYTPKIDQSKILDYLDIKAKSYFIVSTNREENIDNLENMHKIITKLNKLADDYNLPIIVSTHPRTRKNLER
jgi:UDP-N-acetylglucosamine 2-epimerase